MEQRLLVGALKKVVANSFMNALNTKFAPFMREDAIQKKVIEQAEDYSEAYENDDELLEEAFNERYPAWMHALERHGRFEDGGLVVYRGISANSTDDIDYDSTGVYWTWDKNKAANYSDTNTKLDLHTLTALVKIDDIDLKETFLKIVWPGYEFDESEREITLKPNRTITLLDNEERDTVTSINTNI